MKINYDMLPIRMRDPIRDYIEHGTPVGDFLQAVITNNFMMAVLKADVENYQALFQWARFFYMEAPARCSGSPAVYEAWVNMGGLRGNQRDRVA